MPYRRLDFLLVFYGFPHNHQGHDLNSLLNASGRASHLLYFDKVTTSSTTGIRYSASRPGLLSKVGVLRNLLRFVFKGLWLPARCIVAFNSISLLASVPLKVLFRSRLIYYCLEHESYSLLRRWLIRAFCDGIINVEENRQGLLRTQLPWKGRDLVFYNVPRRLRFSDVKPTMRDWLGRHHAVSRSAKILMYAGSDQAYARLFDIVSWAKILPEGVLLTLMLPHVPGWLSKGSFERVILLPSQAPEHVPSWLCDADIALLPYEAEDVAVHYCSPQKLFDCLACRVPFIGSNRPIIQKVLDEFPCGVVCDFTQQASFLNAVALMLRADLRAMRDLAAAGHEKYNYESAWPELREFLEGSNHSWSSHRSR